MKGTIWAIFSRTIDCRKQSMVPAVSQSNKTWARSLLLKRQIWMYVRKRDIKVREKHRWTEEIGGRRWWISNVFGERGIKQGWGVCKIQACKHWWYLRLEGMLRTDKHNKCQKKKILSNLSFLREWKPISEAKKIYNLLISNIILSSMPNYNYTKQKMNRVKVKELGVWVICLKAHTAEWDKYT